MLATTFKLETSIDNSMIVHGTVAPYKYIFLSVK